VLHIVDKGETYEGQVELLLQFLRMPLQLLAKQNRQVQAAGALCLQKVIQSASEELVGELLDEITDRIC
jgi:hypothetical protein